MKRIPRYRQTSAIRAFLAIASLHTAADCSLAQESVFNEAVFKRWHEYEDFSRRIQATARKTVSGLEPGTTESYSISYKQNRQCAMFCTNLRWGTTLFRSCLIANPRYSVEIKRNVSDHSNTLLLDYKEDPNAIFPHAGQPLFDVLFGSVSPHFTYHHVRLSDVVLRPSFKANRVSKEMRDGVELVRIDHSYVEDRPHSRAKMQSRRRGSIYFDPARCWCIRQIKESEEFIINGTRDHMAEVEVRNEVTDHPSGFPIIKSKTYVRNGFSDRRHKKIGGTETINYEIEVNEDVPNDEFTLSAFGLPEPAGMEPVKKPIPLYVWNLIAAGVCGVVALVFRHLARRRRLAAAS